jgi:hypothetical protein
MGTYVVLTPCAYVQDNHLVRLRRPGATVELEDDIAAQLGAAVAPQGQPAPATPTPESTLFTPPPPEPAPPIQEAAPDGNT